MLPQYAIVVSILFSLSQYYPNILSCSKLGLEFGLELIVGILPGTVWHRVVLRQFFWEQLEPSGSKDRNNEVSGPNYQLHYIVWAIKPHYLGPWTLRGNLLPVVCPANLL